MNGLVFLALALVISVIGTLVLWARSRQTDTPDSSIEEFRATMRALSEEEADTVSGNRSGRRGD